MVQSGSRCQALGCISALDYARMWTVRLGRVACQCELAATAVIDGSLLFLRYRERDSRAGMP
jgi:hypothetical protein